MSKTLLALSVALLAQSAQSAPISLVDPYQWLENRSTNTLGTIPGLRQQFGVEHVLPNGLGGTTAIATQGSRTLALPYAGATALPDQFSAGIAANPNYYGAWQLNFTNGTDTASIMTPVIAAGLSAMPFVSDVSITSGGAATTMSWKLPTAAPNTVDAVRINLYDHGRVNLAGTRADTVLNVTLAASTTSFTLPQVLATGAGLVTGNLYTAEINLLDFGANVIGPQHDLRNRSRLYVDFVAGSTGGQAVYLPVVAPGVNGAAPTFNFNVSSVGSQQPVYIDPEVAVGYQYQTGAGNPNFASVLLPAGIGDGAYVVQLADGTAFSVQGGKAFNFAAGGVASFKVLGIETSAGLAPNDTSAFVTGLTFTADGAFTGSMTPILTSVPEPATLALWLAGLAVLAVPTLRRRA
jgi:hypothetical protein